MLAAPNPIRLMRGLRFRLALSYVFFFAGLLGVLGVVLNVTLRSIQQKQAEDILDEEWGAVKGYLRFGPLGPDWFYDKVDPEEEFIVARLKHIFLLTDAQGHPLQYNNYEQLGYDSPEFIKTIIKKGPKTRAIQIKKDPAGVSYLVRSGVIIGQDRSPYYFALARVIGDSTLLKEFTFRYALIVSAALVVSGLLGWFLAMRALAPVNSVALAAQRITHSNLSTRIPTRGAGDELDGLVESFNRMMERLNLSFTQIRQFSTDVSHELRTPLTIVRGQLEVALITAKTTEQYRDAMVNALEDVERLSNIVRALLALSQAESGQLAIKPVQFDLAEMCADLVEEFQIPAEAQGVELTARLDAACLIFSDKVQMERLISNLVSNAIKYTPAGGNVVVDVSAEGETIALSVADTGVGIAPDHLPHIFDRFYRVPSADPEKGLGLGLSFVSWIVKALGGTIEVESELNKGSRFRVRLPQGAVAAIGEHAEMSERIH